MQYHSFRPSLPHHLNIAVDSVIWYWVMIFVGEEAGPKDLG